MPDSIACPKCLAPLQPKTLEAIPVDQCPGCRGIWFDEKELQSILAGPHELRGELRRSGGHAGLNQKRGSCPRDNTEMLRAFSTTGDRIVLDICPDCRGLWLDGGELDRLIRAMNG